MSQAAPPPPRLCHIKKWPHFDGYGFNLHAEKNKPGQYVGSIDAHSPADAAGLKEDDRIVEVNGVNVNMENHKQVVGRIKAVVGETRLLVVDKACEEWHREEQVVVRAGLPYVIHLSSERGEEREEKEVIDTWLQSVSSESASYPVTVDREDSFQSGSSGEEEAATSTGRNSPQARTLSGSDSPLASIQREARTSTESRSPQREERTSSGRPSSPRSESRTSSGKANPQTSVKREASMQSSSSLRNSLSSGSMRSTPSPVDTPDYGLNLNMTAKEMRERLGSQKKRDPRRDSKPHDMRKKFEMIQAL